MKQPMTFGITALSSLFLAASLFASDAAAQQKTLNAQLVGTWTFISSTGKLPDGSPMWGSKPKGLLVFTENGRYSSHITRSDRPKFASNNRLKGTPEENKSTAQASIASFGTYTVNEASKSFTVRFEGSSYPNLEGTEQTRAVTITGDELKIRNPSPSAGGAPTELVYRRAR
jgi:hypothetical protein